MPRDVSTRWNSTFDMLEFAIQYRPAIDAMTAAHNFSLRQYELVSAEWKMASELRDVLKVSLLLLLQYNVPHSIFDMSFRFLKTQHYSSLKAPQILRPSFLPWTSLMACLPRHRNLHTNFVLQSVLPLLLKIGLSISITISLIIQNSIELPWVRVGL